MYLKTMNSRKQDKSVKELQEKKENIRLRKIFPKYASYSEMQLYQIHNKLLIEYERQWLESITKRKKHVSEELHEKHNNETIEYLNSFEDGTFGSKIAMINRMELCIKTYFKSILG